MSPNQSVATWYANRKGITLLANIVEFVLRNALFQSRTRSKTAAGWKRKEQDSTISRERRRAIDLKLHQSPPTEAYRQLINAGRSIAPTCSEHHGAQKYEKGLLHLPNVKDEPRARTDKPWIASYGAGWSAEGVFESLAVKLVGSSDWFGGFAQRSAPSAKSESSSRSGT